MRKRITTAVLLDMMLLILSVCILSANLDDFLRLNPVTPRSLWLLAEEQRRINNSPDLRAAYKTLRDFFPGHYHGPIIFSELYIFSPFYLSGTSMGGDFFVERSGLVFVSPGNTITLTDPNGGEVDIFVPVKWGYQRTLVPPEDMASWCNGERDWKTIPAYRYHLWMWVPGYKGELLPPAGGGDSLLDGSPACPYTTNSQK
jgi:hypothetical protein